MLTQENANLNLIKEYLVLERMEERLIASLGSARPNWIWITSSVRSARRIYVYLIAMKTSMSASLSFKAISMHNCDRRIKSLIGIRLQLGQIDLVFSLVFFACAAVASIILKLVDLNLLSSQPNHNPSMQSEECHSQSKRRRLLQLYQNSWNAHFALNHLVTTISSSITHLEPIQTQNKRKNRKRSL